MVAQGASFAVDTSQGEALTGFLAGMITEISTSRFIAPVMDYAHAEMAKAFDLDLDVIAKSNPTEYYHMYEWRMVGMPKGHLWRHVMEGGGGYVRTATFEFLPSVMPILTPKERFGDPLGIADPIASVDPADLAKLKNRSYKFWNKAMVQEYGLAANVYPVNVHFLFVPTLRNKGNFMLSKHTSQDFSRANPQDASGATGTRGKFTEFWDMWWSEMAPTVWDDNVRLVIEDDLLKSERELTATINKRRSTTKVFKMNVAAGSAAYLGAKAEAGLYFRSQAVAYQKAANAIEKSGAF